MPSNPMYCSINLVKQRILIADNDTSYDSALNDAVKEASRLVDMFLRAYTIVPLTGGVEGGEQIYNGGFELGNLSGWEYNGAIVIDTDYYEGQYSCEITATGDESKYIKQTFSTPIPKSMITSFTLYRKQNGPSNLTLRLFYSDGTNNSTNILGTENWTVYDALNNITENKELSAIKLSGAGCGTIRVDSISLESTEGGYPYEIQQITADFGASIFKRRMMPDDVTLRGVLQPDQINQIDATGWFALGIRKLEQFIKSKYVIQDKPLITTLYNPDIYIELFNRGIITAAEVREYTGKEVTIKDIRETYQYKRQKKFAFIQGVDEEDTYEVQD